eukprot:TRINITY_DN3821_c0_g1_i1.p1 TRINITY_DN3821_c0_g1~~TRINITY_DN3821_c0_g1_i1.p1  ORF type:complete len:119 (-),score=14.21 TRINITY_DN3821_c0_g1_i1:1313-1669(-)
MLTNPEFLSGDSAMSSPDLPKLRDPPLQKNKLKDQGQPTNRNVGSQSMKPHPTPLQLKKNKENPATVEKGKLTCSSRSMHRIASVFTHKFLKEKNKEKAFGESNQSERVPDSSVRKAM